MTYISERSHSRVPESAPCTVYTIHERSSVLVLREDGRVAPVGPDGYPAVFVVLFSWCPYSDCEGHEAPCPLERHKAADRG